MPMRKHISIFTRPSRCLRSIINMYDIMAMALYNARWKIITKIRQICTNKYESILFWKNKEKSIELCRHYYYFFEY